MTRKLEDAFELGRTIKKQPDVWVVEAFPKDRPRTAAVVKVLRTQFAGDIQRRRFEQEIAVLARLTHPHVVRLLDFGDNERGDLWLAMEKGGDRSLQEVIAAEAPLPLSVTRRLLTGILSALEAIHPLGIVHRDLGPANVVVSASGEALLVDLGIALVRDRVTEETRSRLSRSGMLVGTPLYIAPERVFGQPGDARCDLYGAGLILYECLTGKPAISGKSLNEILEKQVNDPPPRPSSVAPSVPRRLDGIVQRALEKSPEDRYADAASFRAALEGACEAISRAPDA